MQMSKVTSRETWMKNIIEWTKLNADQCFRGAEDHLATGIINDESSLGISYRIMMMKMVMFVLNFPFQLFANFGEKRKSFF